MKQFVMMYDNTIAVRMQAIRSASASVLPDFSPRALAHIRQILVIAFAIKHTNKIKWSIIWIMYTVERTVGN